MEEQKKQGHKIKGQKYKSLLVWDILQKRTDENHAIQLREIVEHLKMYGITAERHSVKRDIDDTGRFGDAQTVGGQVTYIFVEADTIEVID